MVRPGEAVPRSRRARPARPRRIGVGEDTGGADAWQIGGTVATPDLAVCPMSGAPAHDDARSSRRRGGCRVAEGEERPTGYAAGTSERSIRPSAGGSNATISTQEEVGLGHYEGRGWRLSPSRNSASLRIDLGDALPSQVTDPEELRAQRHAELNRLAIRLARNVSLLRTDAAAVSQAE